MVTIGRAQDSVLQERLVESEGTVWFEEEGGGLRVEGQGGGLVPLQNSNACMGGLTDIDAK